MDKYLVYINKPNNSTILKESLENDSITIGRGHQNDIVINDDFLNNSHLKITFLENHFIVEDLETINKTYYKGKEFKSKEFKSNENIILKIGRTIIEIVGKDHQKDKNTTKLLAPKYIESLFNNIKLNILNFIIFGLFILLAIVDLTFSEIVSISLLSAIFSTLYLFIDERINDKGKNFSAFFFSFQLLFLIICFSEYIFKMITFFSNNNSFFYLILPLTQTIILLFWGIFFRQTFGYYKGKIKDFSIILNIIFWKIIVIGLLITNYHDGMIEAGSKIGSYHIYPKLSNLQPKTTTEQYINDLEYVSSLSEIDEISREKILEKLD